MIPDTLTVAQAAKAIHRSPRYVRDLIRLGILRASRICDRGRWLVDESSLAQLVTHQEQSRQQVSARVQQELAEARAAGFEPPAEPPHPTPSRKSA